MGQNKIKKDRFFSEHPICCFCGGKRRATTLDHQPARMFFKDRRWPEGFVFPACQKCNNATRHSEQVVGVLIHGENENPERERYLANLRSVSGQFPGVVREMLFLNANAKRSALKQKGLQLSGGSTFGELSLIRLNPEFWEPHLDNLSRKLFLALHYQCFGRPLAPNGGVQTCFYTNADVIAGDIPTEFFELAKTIVFPARARSTLEDQFAIRFSVVDGQDCALFVVQLRKMLVIFGTTMDNLSRLRTH